MELLMQGGAKVLLVVLAVMVLFSSVVGCGTIINGSIPEGKRGSMNVVAFILNLLFFWPGIFIDLATGAFYYPKLSGTK